DAAALAARYEILGRVEGERGRVGEGSASRAVAGGAVGLRRGLAEEQGRTSGDRAEGLHVRHLSVEMDRQDARRSRSDRGLDLLRVEQRRVLLHVGEDRLSADPRDRARAGEERERRREDAV